MHKKSTNGFLKLITAVFFVLSLVLFLGTKSASALTITPIKLELTANPGDTVQQQITLYNETDTDETLYVSYANFEAEGENGNPTFEDPKDDLGTWMTAADKVVLTAKSSQIVPLTINVPKDATPGGHFAAVFWGTVPTTGSSDQVSIGAKTGVLVLLSVTGNVSENGGIIEFGTATKSNFFTSLPIDFYYRFQNNGGDRVKPEGFITMKDMLGFTAANVEANPVDGNVLPSSTRKIDAIWQGGDGPTPVADQDQGNFFNKVGREYRNFAFGHYKAELSLSYGTKNQITTAVFSFWVFPWHLTIFVIVVALLAYFIISKLIRRYNRWVIRRAQEMMQREQSQQSEIK